VLTKTYGMKQSQVDPCLYHRPPCAKKRTHRLWALRYLDDVLFVGHAAEVRALTTEMRKTLRLTNQTYLEQEGDTMRLLGWDITKMRGGFSIHTNDQNVEEILELLSLQKARGVRRQSEMIKTR